MYDTRRQVDNLAHMYICSSFRVTGDQFKTGRLDRIQELVGTERAQVASSCTDDSHSSDADSDHCDFLQFNVHGAQGREGDRSNFEGCTTSAQGLLLGRLYDI